MISAKIIADSISPAGARITTFELELPRIILAEQNTHRAFSRNAQSTRAVPLKRAILNTLSNPFIPEFTEHQPGMMANEPLTGWRRGIARFLWKMSLVISCITVRAMHLVGVSKQHAGRLLEPYQYIRVVCTATDFDNYFHLRCHETAQPEIRELANLMWEELTLSHPVPLGSDDWHVPYFADGYWMEGMDTPLETALMISASCCAQVSYRKMDTSESTAERIYSRLVQSGQPVHSSPFEHQARPLPDAMDKSGNFVGWYQYRQSIAGNHCSKYVPRNL